MAEKTVTVIKLNLERQETWRYTGILLDQDEHQVTLKALFNRPDTPFHEIILKEGDCFIETYYTDRWYNIFAIHDRQDGNLKGWYCNLCYPAEISENEIAYVDLALDLLIYPDGRQTILDQDEYDKLNLPAESHRQVRKALHELQNYFTDLVSGTAPDQ